MSKTRLMLTITLLVLVTVNLTGTTDSGVTLDKTVFTAKGTNETLLHITKPGCYSIQSHSKQGTGITIVDRVKGPYKSSGSAGGEDGRMDLILDKGTYKIRLGSHEKGSGDVKLTVAPYKEIHPVKDVADIPFLPDLKIVEENLGDLQQYSCWVEIKKRHVLRIEMLGRNLSNALLWREGTWLSAIEPTIGSFERIPGQPMTYIEFHHDINPGLYLLVCYGGKAQPWTKQSKRNPFYLRMGVPYIGANGQRLLTISPFGRDTFLADGKSDFFQLQRKDKKDATLTLSYWGETRSRFYNNHSSASISKKSRDPWCTIKQRSGRKKQWVTITARPGDDVELDFFKRQYDLRIPTSSGNYWMSTIHSVEGRDAIDATGIISHSGSKPPIKTGVIRLENQKPVVRKINMLKPFTVYLYIEKGGTYRIEESKIAGAKGEYQLKRFMIIKPRGYREPPFQGAGTDFEVTAGYYVLTVRPRIKGILHFALHEKGGWFLRSLDILFKNKKTGPAHSAVVWPRVHIPYSSPGEHYRFYMNRRGGVDTGFILRSLPMQLMDPLPIPLQPGQRVELSISHNRKMKLQINPASVLEVDGQAWNIADPLSPGEHRVTLVNKNSKGQLYNIRAVEAIAYTPPPKPVLKPIEKIFPILTEAEPLFRDFERTEVKEFLLQVKEPGLYRLETTGRMATALTVRTRTTTSLYSVSQNGIGRNGLVQQYLKPGDYLVQVQTKGKSKGRAGIILRHTKLEHIKNLSQGMIKRKNIHQDAAVRFEVNISKSGRYHLETYSLGKALTHRLDDNEGWPLMVPGGRGAVNQYFDAGTYYYYSLPLPVESRRLTFLKRVADEEEPSGKGPHRLRFNRPIGHTWLEDDRRSPDIYILKIGDPLAANLTIDGGMEVEIFKDNKKIASTSAGQWQGPMAAGSYRLEARNWDKNNQVPYRINLSTPDMIPGMTRTIRKIPYKVNLSLGKGGLMEVISVGDMDVKAVLKDQSGRVITEVDDMADDWNFKISRNLVAGRYSLELSPSLSNAEIKPLELRMKRRNAIVSAKETLPFTINKTLMDDVLEVPFTVGNEEKLLAVIAETAHVKLALVKMPGRKLLAESDDALYIPLAAKGSYSLMVWNGTESKVLLSLKATGVKAKQITVTGQRQTIGPGTGVLLAATQPGAAFALKQTGGNGTVYYSPAVERPCLKVTGNIESTTSGKGWLVSSHNNSRVVMEPAEIIDKGPIDMMFSDKPVTFKIKRSRRIPYLLEVKSVNALMGTAIFPNEKITGNLYRRAGMLAKQARTLAGIPAEGEFRVHTWLTAPTPPVTSEKNRFLSGERVTFKLTGFPRQEEIDFSEGTVTEAQVEPGQSVWVNGINGKNGQGGMQDLHVTLSQGLAAFSWAGDEPGSIVAAVEKNIEARIMVKGEQLYIVNRGDVAALFRVEREKFSGPGQRVTRLDGAMERFFAEAGQLNIQLPELDSSTKLVMAGHDISGRIWGEGGKLFYPRSVGIAGNIQMAVFDVTGGFLEIRHGPGLVKIYQAADDEIGTIFMGDLSRAVQVPLVEGVGRLTGQLQKWEFTLDKPRYVSLETASDTVMGLFKGEELLFLSSWVTGLTHRLHRYLQAGTYWVLTRALAGKKVEATLKMNMIEPEILEEHQRDSETGAAKGMKLIRPGELQVFRFVVTVESHVGVGLITESDSLEGRLFDESSRQIAAGTMVWRKMKPGQYTFVVKTDNDNVPVQYKPILYGSKGSRGGVPQKVIQKFKQEAAQ